MAIGRPALRRLQQVEADQTTKVPPCIFLKHRGPCRDPQRHRHCPGLWRGEITLGHTGDGKRTRRKVSGTTKAAVVDKLRDLHHQLDKGTTHRGAR